MRDHDVTMLTGYELEVARRELAASLALARPDSAIRGPILVTSERGHGRTRPARGYPASWESCGAGSMMTKRCCDYSFIAHSPTDRRTGELLACPRSRYQALLIGLAALAGLTGRAWSGAGFADVTCDVRRNRRARAQGRRYCRKALYVVIPAQSSGAASTSLKLSGIGTSASMGTNIYCWYPPS